MARDYTRLKAFTAADDLVVDVYELTRGLPPMSATGCSPKSAAPPSRTPTNIVEGSIRRSDKHYLRYLESALGSACEVRYLLGLCSRLQMRATDECDTLIERYTAVVKGLAALISRIDGDLQNRRADRQPPTAER
jgi:four helix bundle protein